MSENSFSLKSIRPISHNGRIFSKIDSISDASDFFLDDSNIKSSTSFASTEASFGEQQSTIQENILQDDVSAFESSSLSAVSRDGLIELTKTSKYCVSKLPATPAFLKETHVEETLKGTSDQSTEYALVLAKNGAFVWNYTSPDQVSQSYFFPSSGYNSTPILGTLVSPVAGVKEPGFITVVPDTGLVTYWESIGGIIANELLQKKKVLTLEIKLHGSEKIEILESIEPAGIIASTNIGRFIFITFCDSTGKPSLHAETMRGTGSGILATLKGAITLAGSRRDVVSIKTGQTIGRDQRQALVITASGNLLIWDCQRSGQTSLVLEENLREVMLNTFVSLYPHGASTFQVHDIEYNSSLNYIYLLASFVNNPVTSEVFYLLFTLSTAENNVQIISTHRFRTFTSHSSCRPQLVLPSPFKTLFVLFSDAVILTDAAHDNFEELGNLNRWEDIIPFLPGVEAFAFGQEDSVVHNKKVSKYPGVIAITKNAGILRIERYPDEEEKDVLGPELSAEELGPALAKTRIEQAVFYGHKNEDINPVDFMIRPEFHFTQEVLDNAFSQVSADIISSTSPYLPPLLPSQGEYLQLRWQSLNYLCAYLQENFPDELSIGCRLSLLWDLEKLCAAKSLWTEYNNILTHASSNPVAASTANIWSQIITNSATPAKSDKVRHWFRRDVREIVNLLTEATKYDQASGENIAVTLEVNKILLISVTQSTYNTREGCAALYFNLSQDSFCEKVPWTATKELMQAFEHQYTRTVAILDSLSPSDENYKLLSEQLISLVQTLCAIYTERIRWMETFSADVIQKEAEKLSEEYKSRRGEWIQNLSKFGHKSTALDISERYQIYRSLAEILGSDYLAEVKAADNQDTRKSMTTVLKLQYYIQKFGYDFAHILFEYYAETNQIKALLKQFPQYNEYLERFFKQGNYDRISWIHDLTVENYERAAEKLLNVSVESERSIKNKRLQLSIAKLSAIASGLDPQTPAGPTLSTAIDFRLETVDILESIQEQLAPYLNIKSESTEVTMYPDGISEFLDSQNMASLKAVLNAALTRFVKKEALSTEELIDILTLVDVGGAPGGGTPRLNFARALRLVALPTSGLTNGQVKFNTQLIWRRLYIRDNWEVIERTENQSDEVVQKTVAGTLLYKTLATLVAKDAQKYAVPSPYVLDPAQALWEGNLDAVGEAARYPSASQKGPSDVAKENELLSARIGTLAKWAPGVHARVVGEVKQSSDGKAAKIPGEIKYVTESERAANSNGDVEMGDSSALSSSSSTASSGTRPDVDGDVEM